MEFLGKKTSSKTKIKTAIKPKKEKVPIIKGPWLYKEDLLLQKWVEEHGPTNWWACAKTIPGRNSRQCNQHWNISLKPSLSIGHWTSEEIFLIMIFYKKFNGSWRKMIPIFKSRSENSIKNIFFSQLRKISKFYINIDYQKENIGLTYLLKFYDIAFEQIKEKFLKDNPITEKELEEYIKNIEIMLENKPNDQKYIYLEKIRPKPNKINIENNITIKNLDERDISQECEDNLNSKNIKTNQYEIMDEKEKNNKKEANNNEMEINTKNNIYNNNSKIDKKQNPHEKQINNKNFYKAVGELMPLGVLEY